MSGRWDSLAGRIAGGVHRLPVRIYYEDTDLSGLVYHANYLRFMERGRSDYLRLLGVEQGALIAQAQAEAPGFGFVVRSMKVDFLKPARMDDVVEVCTTPREVAGASITLLQRVVRGDETLVEADVRVAFIAGGKAQRIPKALREAMRADR
jgi:acyl-CoA thioester hydrolase